MDTKNPYVLETKKSPTEISQLALEFLKACGEDPSLMTRVYHTAMTLVGAPSGAPPMVIEPKGEGSNRSTQASKTFSSEKVPEGLTSEEVKRAKEEFRQKNEIRGKLTPEQAKVAKAIFRQKKEWDFYAKARAAKSNDQHSSKNLKVKEEKKEVITKPLPSERKPSKEGIAQLDGTRKTWSTKLLAMRQRALERSVAIETDDSDIVAVADYYNARLTLDETWSRFQNTYDCSGKKDPLVDLLPLPKLELIEIGFKKMGVKLRQHPTGHIILQDEATGASLRRK